MGYYPINRVTIARDLEKRVIVVEVLDDTKAKTKDDVERKEFPFYDYYSAFRYAECRLSELCM